MVSTACKPAVAHRNERDNRVRLLSVVLKGENKTARGPRAVGAERQSRKATFRMAFDWPSVFIRTRCQPCSTTVLWSACRMRPRTKTPGFRCIGRQPQPFAFGLPARRALYRASVTPFG